MFANEKKKETSSILIGKLAGFLKKKVEEKKIEEVITKQLNIKEESVEQFIKAFKKEMSDFKEFHLCFYQNAVNVLEAKIDSLFKVAYIEANINDE